MVDLYGFYAGKDTVRPMDPMGLPDCFLGGDFFWCFWQLGKVMKNRCEIVRKT